MNKGRRNELRKLHYKRRAARLPKDGSYNAFKSDRVPCSCWLCRDEKYRDRQRSRDKTELSRFVERQINIEPGIVEMVNKNFWDLI